MVSEQHFRPSNAPAHHLFQISSNLTKHSKDTPFCRHCLLSAAFIKGTLLQANNENSILKTESESLSYVSGLEFLQQVMHL